MSTLAGVLRRSARWRRRPLPFAISSAASSPSPPCSTSSSSNTRRRCLSSLPHTTTTTTHESNNEGGLGQRLQSHEQARKDQATDVWKANVVADSLALLRGEEANRRRGKGDVLSHRQALLTLGHYAEQLAPADALRVIHQALKQPGLGKVAFTTYQELSKREDGLAALLADADALLIACCKAEKHRMAMMLVEQVQQAHFEPSVVAVPRHEEEGQEDDDDDHKDAAATTSSSPSPLPYFSREASMALLRLLSERDRYRDHWRFAESMVKDKRLPRSPVDVEVVAGAMVVAWKARNWASVQRLLAFLAGKGGIPLPTMVKGGGGGGGGGGKEKGEIKDHKTLATMRNVIETLQRREAARLAKKAGTAGSTRRVASSAPPILTTNHLNMFIFALLRLDQVDEAKDLLTQMFPTSSSTSTSTSSVPLLPPPDALSLSMVMDALGSTGDWQQALHLLNQAKSLPTSALSTGGLRLLYKTAIAALGKQGMWEGALSLFYEMHEQGVYVDAQVYTTLLKALKEGGRLDLVLSFLETMKEQNITPTRPTYNVLFSFLGQEGRMDDALRLFEEMKQELGLEATPYDYGTLMSACGKALSKCHSDETAAREVLIKQAETLLREAEECGAFASRSPGQKDGGLGNCYMQMLKVYGKAGQWEAARNLLLDGMPRMGFVEPTFAHFYEAMRACAHAEQPDAALALLEHLRKNKSAGGVGGGRSGGKHVHILCWNAAMLACQRSGRWETCLHLLQQMQAEGQAPGHINYARTIQACGDAGQVEEAWKLYQELVANPLHALDQATYGSMLLACGQARQTERVHQILNDMRERRGGMMLHLDGLTVAQAVAALALDGGQIEAGRALLRKTEEEGAASSLLLAFHVLLLAVLRHSGAAAAGGQGVKELCQGLVDEMMESHGLCPTSTTKALLQEAGCDVSTLFVDGGGRGDEDAAGAVVSGVQAVEARIRHLLRVNPHDALKRREVCAGE